MIQVTQLAIVLFCIVPATVVFIVGLALYLIERYNKRNRPTITVLGRIRGQGHKNQ